MTVFAIVMLEESFIYCQPTANSRSGQHHPLPENKLCLPPSTVPCLCNSITTQFFVKVSQIARQGRQHILHNHRDSPSQAHIQPHGKALGWLLAELRAVAAPSGSPWQGMSLEIDSAKLSSLNSSIGTYRKKKSGLNSYWAAESTVDLLHQEVPGSKIPRSNILNEAFPFQLKAIETRWNLSIYKNDF